MVRCESEACGIEKTFYFEFRSTYRIRRHCCLPLLTLSRPALSSGIAQKLLFAVSALLLVAVFSFTWPQAQERRVLKVLKVTPNSILPRFAASSFAHFPFCLLLAESHGFMLAKSGPHLCKPNNEQCSLRSFSKKPMDNKGYKNALVLMQHREFPFFLFGQISTCQIIDHCKASLYLGRVDAFLHLTLYVPLLSHVPCNCTSFGSRFCLIIDDIILLYLSSVPSIRTYVCTI